MTTKTHVSPAAAAVLLGLLGALVGCSTTGLRQSTSEMSVPGSSIAQLEDNDARPEPIAIVRPDYPLTLKRAGVEGVATVHCLIDETGRVQETKLVSASNQAFGQSAVEALKLWTFQPGRLAGQPTAMRVSIPVRFTLDNP